MTNTPAWAVRWSFRKRPPSHAGPRLVYAVGHHHAWCFSPFGFEEMGGINFELHIYASDDHGFSIGTSMATLTPAPPRVGSWVGDSIGWLGEIMGALTYNGFSEPTLSPNMNGDREPFLSVRCTINHLRKQGDTVNQLMEVMYAPFRKFCEANDYDFEGSFSVIGGGPAKDMMLSLQVSAEEIEKLDKALSAIPNICE